MHRWGQQQTEDVGAGCAESPKFHGSTAECFSGEVPKTRAHFRLRSPPLSALSEQIATASHINSITSPTSPRLIHYPESRNWHRDASGTDTKTGSDTGANSNTKHQFVSIEGYQVSIRAHRLESCSSQPHRWWQLFVKVWRQKKKLWK